jgi:hypothetical protein
MTLAVRFLDLGVGVFPLRPRSKEPACRSWDDYTCFPAQAAQLKNYGVRLTNWFGVADTDNAEAETWARIHLPATPFIVQTARGIHRYYRIVGSVSPFIYRDGLKIEFRNQGQYVVGPGSVHPSGHIYTASDWSWVLTDLPIFHTDFLFDDRPARAPQSGESAGPAYEFPDVVTEPGRHVELFKLLRQCKGRGWDRESTRDVIRVANECRCQPPIREDVNFDQWFHRAWTNPDRPFPSLVEGYDTRTLRRLGLRL